MSFKLTDLIGIDDVELEAALSTYSKLYTNNINKLHYYDVQLNSKKKYTNTYFGELNPNVYVEPFTGYKTLSDSIIRIADAFYDYFENKSLFLLKSILVNDDIYDYDIVISDSFIKISKMKEYGNYQLSPFKEEILIENFSDITASDYVVKLYSILVDILFKRNSYLLTTYEIFLNNIKGKIQFENPLDSEDIIAEIDTMYNTVIQDFTDGNEMRLVFKIYSSNFDDSEGSETINYFNSIEIVDKTLWDKNVSELQDGYATKLIVENEIIDTIFVDFDAMYDREDGSFKIDPVLINDSRNDDDVDVSYSIVIPTNDESISDVLSITTMNPPIDPTDGDRYIVPIDAFGDWFEHDNKIATYDSNNTIWTYEEFPFGTSNGLRPLTNVLDTNLEYVYNGHTWTTKSALDLALIEQTLKDSIIKLIEDQFVFVPDNTTEGTIIYKMHDYYTSINYDNTINKYILDRSFSKTITSLIKYIQIEQNKIIDR